MKLTDDYVKQICRLGQGENCCAFLVIGSKGFECALRSPELSRIIIFRLENGAMSAKGRGKWKGCHWENKET